MIKVTIELISAVSASRNRILGTMEIANDSTGDKVEAGETPAEAMNREFQEEAGHDTMCWRHFLNMGGVNDDGSSFSVDFFAGVIVGNDLSGFHSMEDEQLEIVEVASIHALRRDVIDNLPWIVALAVDFMQDGRPGFVTAQYNP